MKCVHLIVSGKVQGVFFRDNARKKAIQLDLKGFARNLADGTVEVIAQGDSDKINELIDFIRKGPGKAKVKEVQIKNSEMENFDSFEIRY